MSSTESCKYFPNRGRGSDQFFLASYTIMDCVCAISITHFKFQKKVHEGRRVSDLFLGVESNVLQRAACKVSIAYIPKDRFWLQGVSFQKRNILGFWQITCDPKLQKQSRSCEEGLNGGFVDLVIYKFQLNPANRPVGQMGTSAN